MKKSVLVIGVGRFGRGVIEGLYERGHDIFAIDQNEEALDDVRDMIISGAILDVGEDDEELARVVGDKNFDEAVVAMGADFEGALIATNILKDAGVNVSVKAPNLRRGNVLKKMGADRVVFPERDMGRRLAHVISTEAEIEMLELPQGFIIEQLEVGPGFTGKTIEKLNASNRFGFWILLVYKDGEPIQPTATTRLNKGDIMVVFGKKTKLNKFEKANFKK
ncbi:potassium channel family protein [Desulfoscipio geothermicus]|uniref:Trk system potassium uptake protein TrkA n=1 Tax=Desulfoscipio geothermicus DSM 3669 TaxID=1121426 RepID=A0A1I6DXA7_9FIRM|nr:TrkA family potassium uptake protein [Desulfoscipio geothermicus]SFR10065.1 trk system potassium uptake protein TrkA [Desulfoscipio geothermicus DSM 3669]